MLKLATVLDNPGEPLAETRYRDPRELKALGYNAVCYYETTCLSGVSSLQAIVDRDLRHWLTQQVDHIAQRIEAARAEQLQVFVSYDVLCLARDVVEQDVARLTCRSRSETLCPASEPAVDLSVQALGAMLELLPDVDGVVLRFGDTDAARMPHLIGNDIYAPHCARCAQFGRADRIVQIVGRFYDQVVQRMGKTLIARTWNLRPKGMHDSPELCQRIVERLPGPDDDRLKLSFKFTETDFWRYQRFNRSSLVCGQRPIIYELECQREFEGKGGIANWQVPLWQKGCPEMAEHDPIGGLSGAASRVKLAGLWSWVRGGGWGGPFLKNETWVDANAFAVPLLADDPRTDPHQLAHQWIRDRVRVQDKKVAAVLVEMLDVSPQVILDGFYIGPYARKREDPWHPNGDWVQDDLIDAEAAWRIIQRLPEKDLDEVIRQKQRAVEAMTRQRNQLQKATTSSNRAMLEPLMHTVIYGESLFTALRDLLGGLVAYRRYRKGQGPEQADLCRQRLSSAQSHWSHHTQRHGALPGAATAFRESSFWDLTQRLLAELS